MFLYFPSCGMCRNRNQLVQVEESPWRVDVSLFISAFKINAVCCYRILNICHSFTIIAPISGTGQFSRTISIRMKLILMFNRGMRFLFTIHVISRAVLLFTSAAISGKRSVIRLLIEMGFYIHKLFSVV